jgi:pimeloyl-ACP methyl ester carboxylesterase
MDFDYVVMPALILVVALLVVWFCTRRMRSLSAKAYRISRKIAECIVLSFIALLAIILGVSTSFNAIELYHFRATNPPPGDLYTVDGHKMHIHCMGSGSPALVLESGSGGDALVWGGVQPVLSQTTRACSYDRAGMGWSEPQQGPRDSAHIVSELHELLRQANVTGPIVLVGHSAAGIYMSDYAVRYPKDVAGIVFVDSVSPFPTRPASSQTDRVSKIMTLMYRPLFILGVPRLMGFCSQPKAGFDAHTGLLQREDLCHTEYGPVLRELEGRERWGQQTAPIGSFGELPLLILSHDPSQKQWDKQLGDGWNQSQEGLKKLSVRSWRVIAKNSGHYIQFDRPDLIEKEVPRFIEQIRGTTPWPTAFGCTITE